MATEEGVDFCLPYRNIVSKAALELPELPDLLTSLSPALVAHRVCMALDGVTIEQSPAGTSLEGLLGEQLSNTWL
jgi:hypothetical protein